MYEIEQIEQLFGNDVLQYLTRKNLGGVSNEKGNTYENFFAIYKLALLSQEVIENKRNIIFYSQILAFIDDLIIDFDDNTLRHHYQLKNSITVKWGSGLKSIADDFSKQYELNQVNSIESLQHLVVSDSSLKTKLDNDLPDHISDYSQIVHFPYQSNIVKLIAQKTELYEAIKYLCAFSEPDPDKIECVATVLLGAWASTDKSGASVKEILETAQKCQPSYIRSFGQQMQIDTEVANILNQIENFTYNLTKGFLHWEYANGLEEGTLPYSIESDKFQRFQELIKRNKPTSFEDIEAFLI
jgi:hypothetical protein